MSATSPKQILFRSFQETGPNRATGGQILNEMNQLLLRAIYLYEQKFATSSKDAADGINASFGAGTTSERTVNESKAI